MIGVSPLWPSFAAVLPRIVSFFSRFPLGKPGALSVGCRDIGLGVDFGKFPNGFRSRDIGTGTGPLRVGTPLIANSNGGKTAQLFEDLDQHGGSGWIVVGRLPPQQALDTQRS